MADEPTTPATGDDDTDDTTTEKTPPAPRSDDDVEKLKAALRKANKEAEQSRLKLKELEDRDKSDAERLADSNRTLEERAKKAEIDACRMRIAIRKGLTEAQVKRLLGTTEEELEADADELLEAFKTATPEPPSGGRPKERLRPGAVSDAEPDPDPEKTVAAIPRF